MRILESGWTGREFFGNLLNDMNLKGIAVEVGTHRGAFMGVFMRRWKGKQLYCVDHWQNNYCPGDPISERGDREKDYRAFLTKLRNIREHRVTTLRMTSLDATVYIARRLKRQRSKGLGFVYIDASHRYVDCLNDLRAWFPLIRRGGVLAGHDIGCGEYQPGSPWDEFRKTMHRQVYKAVKEFANEHDLQVYRVREPNKREDWSYYMIKT